MSLKLLLQDHNSDLGVLKAGELVDDGESRYPRLVASGAAFVAYDAPTMRTPVQLYLLQRQALPTSVPSLSVTLSGAGALPVTVTPASVLTALAGISAPMNVNGQKVTNAGTPTDNTDLATKAYVDAVAVGLRQPKASCRVATTANLVALSGLLTVDGVTLVAGDRVLVKNQSTGSQNGIYVVAAGAWSRAPDADTDPEVTSGMFTFVDEGSANADTGWVLSTANPIVVGTTSLLFVKFTSIGGDVVGPASSTQFALARYADTGGKTLLSSGVTLTGSDAIEVPNTVGSALRLFNTADKVTNTEVASVAWSSNILTISTAFAGSGTSARSIRVSAGSSSHLTVAPSTGVSVSSSGGNSSSPAFTVANDTTFVSTTAAQSALSIIGTVNQASGTSSYSAILVNPTLTAVGSGGAYLFRGQTGGTDRFTVSAAGGVVCADITAGGDVTTTGMMRVARNTAPPAGGTAGLGLRLFSTTNFGFFGGQGAPTLSAAKGSMYLRTDGTGTNDRAYINTDGGTTWTALVTVA